MYDNYQAPQADWEWLQMLEEERELESKQSDHQQNYRSENNGDSDNDSR